MLILFRLTPWKQSCTSQGTEKEGRKDRRWWWRKKRNEERRRM